ncbi:hypothetical protein LTR95_004087 [Oleoguttula sp. CCFEE 5521]
MASLSTPPMASAYQGRRSDLAASLYGIVRQFGILRPALRLDCSAVWSKRYTTDVLALTSRPSAQHEAKAQEVKGATTSIDDGPPTTSSTEHLTRYQLSARAVFSVCELLELILVNLDPRSIFRLRRVDKFWQQLIGNSKALARATYLLPARLKPPVGQCETLQLHQPRYTHRMLQRLMAEKPFPYRNGGMVYFDVCQPNDAFTPTQLRHIGTEGKMKEQSQSKLVTGINARLFEVESGTTPAKTFTTQPPCTQAIFAWQIQCNNRKHRHPTSHSACAFSTLTRETGITVEDVRKEVCMAMNANQFFAKKHVIKRSCLKFVFIAYSPKQVATRAASKDGRDDDDRVEATT